MRFLTGTSQAKASVVVVEGERLEPGREGLVQFLLEESLVLAPGDPYVIRFASPAVTVGGGVVLRPESERVRRKREATITPLKRWEQALGDPQRMAEECLLSSGLAPTDARQIAGVAGLSVEQASSALEALRGTGTVVAVTGTSGAFVHRSAVDEAGERIVSGLKGFHAAHPHVKGMNMAALRSGTGLRPDVADLAIRQLASAGTVRIEGATARLATHEPMLEDEESDLAGSVEALYREKAFTTPRPAEAAEILRADQKAVQRVMEHLVDQRVLTRLGPGLYMHRDAVEKGESILRQYMREHGELDSYYFKTLIGSTRRYALGLLDYYDAKGITIRHGNVRHLKS